MSGVIGITVFGTNYFINLQQSIVIEMTKQKNLTFSFNTLVSDLTLHFFFFNHFIDYGPPHQYKKNYYNLSIFSEAILSWQTSHS